ncbi:hypothetical protein BN8_00341 [Fibrisoma limi BUZ 3]|uniref:Uncharacterized protein n=1 Tax=Fibrisoma limi BUZ 3 TaxID=1185876 RepID=I2GBZ4_9BACT|nr:hypothetical protein [Fibrisoma limi]CCH51418.1 hypothetical protein BN8_00341 [Fibrisoma limi BUZ 3]
MNRRMIDGDPDSGGGRVEGEGTFNGGMTTEQMAGMEPLPNEDDNADIESNTLGGTSDTGAGPVGDGEPADADQ